MSEEKKTGSARTQAEVRDEEWSDARLAAFLELLPPASLPADYNILLKAYRGMTASLFARFIKLYVDAGHDINVKLADGSTFLQLVLQHRKSAEYATILEAAGATK
ncbi:MAG: hypothetical protein EXR84_08765 [Gammaproteobacteria bacterium]|nr:hypothetical protein [Gammaproteobacteria bacterium]